MIQRLLTHAANILGADNERVVNLRAVQWAKLHYINQYNQEVNKPPKLPTHRLRPMLRTDLVFGSTESMYDRAERLDMLDRWCPVLYMQLSANHTLKFTGDKALSLWAAWKAKQYGNK